MISSVNVTKLAVQNTAHIKASITFSLLLLCYVDSEDISKYEL